MDENIIIEETEWEEPAQEQALPEEVAEEVLLPEPPTEAAEDNPIAAHVEEMGRRFPNVDIIKLDGNPAFRRFAGSRYGKESLADLYEAYTELVSKAEMAASAKSSGKASRATGGSSGKSGSALNVAQRAALQRWNESNPDMKMTEKEFLQRG